MCRLHLAGIVALAVLLGESACKTETTLADYPCPPGGTTLTYDTFGAAFLGQSCQTCHGQTDGARKGAPDGYDFGTLAAVRAQKERIFARAAADNVTMPPGPTDPPAAEREKLAQWLACGAP